MAKFTDVNTIVTNGSEAIFRLKAQMKAAGWVVNQSSDGSTYNAAGDQITLAGSGAGGMDNANAWFELQEPETNGRTWSFQHITESTWRVKLSVAAGFSGGTPGITRVGSATDEQVMLGAGTDAAPTGTTLFGAAGTYRIHCTAQSTPEGPAGNRAYGWAVFSSTSGAGVLNTLVFQDPLAVGTYPPLTGTRLVPTAGEADPCIYGCEANLNGFLWNSLPPSWGDNNASTPIARGFFAYGYGTQAFVRFPGDEGQYFSASTENNVGKFGSGAHGFDTGLPIRIARPSGGFIGSEAGLKGETTFLKMAGTARSYPDTGNLSSDAHAYAGELLIPYEDGTAPLL